MIVFYIVEVSIIVALYIFYNLAKGSFANIGLFFINLGIYPLQQAFLIFYLKSSKDPIEGISKLDALCLVSKTQIKNKNFI